MIRRARRAVRQLVASAPPSLLVRASAVRHGELRGPSGPAGAAPGPGESLSGVRALDDHLHVVLDALAAGAVPAAVLEAGTMRRRVVVVTGDHAPAARRALAATTATTATGGGLLVAAVAADGSLGAAHPIASLAQTRSTREARVLRVHSGQQRLGCDVEFWALSDDRQPRPDGSHYPAGTALAPRPNRWTRSLEPDQRRPVTGEVAGRPVPTYPGLLRPHLLDVRFPIDVVYTWVDGSDPAWRQRKDDAWAASHHGEHHPSASAGSRFDSHDELRYSLRSLEANADWVRQVFVVTDEQTPSWLRTDHPRLRVVSHRELFGGTGTLPTFNSHAIESRLHHIDGLAEHFLYLNDDVFFGRPVTPEVFYEGNGLARFFLTDATIDLGEPGARDLPVASAAKQTRAAVAELYGASVTQRFQHVAHPQRRSVLADVEELLPDQVRRTGSAQFRSPHDLSVPASLAHYVGYATGRAVPGTLSYAYCDVTERRAPIKLQRIARDRATDVFCLNETDAPGEHAGHRLMADFLAAYFPRPSSFERPAQADAR
ncbi:hypothetical protein GCM10023145_06180 [Angustibacter luteus]